MKKRVEHARNFFRQRRIFTHGWQARNVARGVSLSNESARPHAHDWLSAARRRQAIKSRRQLRSTKEKSTQGDQRWQGQDIKTALKRFAVEETLAGCQNVIAVKFRADFAPKLHTMVKENAAYDNLPVKQSPWDISS